MKRSLACLCALLLAGSATAAERYTLSLSAEVLGPTPAVLGYNLGHTLADTNTHDWFRYTEVNGFRVWSSPTHIEPQDDLPPWGDGVADREGFLARRTALRADPLNHEFINWPVFEQNFRRPMTGTNRLAMHDVLTHARERGLTPLVMIHRGAGSYPFRDAGERLDWASRWEAWQHYYAQAFWLARNFDVERFQVYNEPDHSINMRMPQQEYIERLKIGSDAIQAALADVNRLYGKALQPRISAPVTVAAVTPFHPRRDPERRDQRDAERGWGELTMEHRRKPHFPEAVEDFTNFQVYAYQQYSRNGPSFGEQYAEMRRLVAGANDGEPLPVIITEFNVLANYQFRRTEDTMHTPRRAARLGSILVNLVNERPDELYVFKFGQTVHATEKYVAKNGNFWQENDTPPHGTGGGTRGAEVYRLIMRAFQKDRELLRPPQWRGKAPDLTWAGASHDPATGLFHVFIVTERGAATPLELDFSALGIATPGLAILEEVSVARHGAVRALVQVPESGRLQLELSPETAWLLTVPRAAFQFALSPAAEDAHVQAGRARARNFGADKVMRISGHVSRSDSRTAAYLKFLPEDLPVSEARRVLLRLHARATEPREILPAHVYGLTDSSWTETGIRADNAPNLALHGGQMRAIADNRVSGQGESAFILGTLTATEGFADQFVDVTEFVRAHPEAPSFLITQETRYPGELSYKGAIEMTSREAGPQLAPQLIFLY